MACSRLRLLAGQWYERQAWFTPLQSDASHSRIRHWQSKHRRKPIHWVNSANEHDLFIYDRHESTVLQPQVQDEIRFAD